MFCGKCGQEIPDEYTFCTKCGSSVEMASAQSEAPPGPPASAPERSPTRLRMVVAFFRALAPVVLVLAIIGGFMAADRLELHWYVPQDNSDLEEEISTTSSSLTSLRGRVSSLESDASFGAAGSVADLDTTMRFMRITQAVTLNSLVMSYGGQQSTTSAAGEACYAWLMDGEGSAAECGFTR